MARIPVRGAAVVTPYRSEAELRKVLEGLCPDFDFSPAAVNDIYWRLGSFIGHWSAEQQRIDTLSVARALTAISKNVAAATCTLSAHQTGIHDVRDIELVSQLKEVLIADPEVGSLERADELISSQNDPEKLSQACLVAARNLKRQTGTSGRPQAKWHDDFTDMLLQIAREAGVEPTSWKDRDTQQRKGWLFEAAQRLGSFLDPEMMKGDAEACGTRLDRSKRRLKRGKFTTR